jgi:folate-binding protein YgfZ
MDSYHALTAGCGVVDLSNRSRVWLTGADRLQFLNGFCTNDIKRLGMGQGCEAFLTNHQGKTVAHVISRVQQGDALVLDTSQGQAAKIIQHLDRFVISDRVEFQDQSAATGELLVAGKEASRVLAGVSQAALPANLWDHALVSIAGLSCVIQKVDYAGEGSYFLTTRSEETAAVQKALVAAGAEICDERTAETVRIESGFPLFGIDITDDNLPQEIGRNQQAISFTKGCYLGQETVARIDALGHVNRLLVRVEFAGKEVPPPGTELLSEEKPVGKVTSACWSPRHNGPLAFALLRRVHTNPGAKLASTAGPAEVLAASS